MNLPEQPTESFKYFAGDGAKELCRRCLRAAGDAECSQYEEMYRKYREYFSETCMYKVVPYEGIPELLEKLKAAGIKISVLSNKPHAQAVDVVETCLEKAILTRFRGRPTAFRESRPPSGQPSRGAFPGGEKGLPLHRDTATDMETGKAAEMETVGVLWGFPGAKQS